MKIFNLVLASKALYFIQLSKQVSFSWNPLTYPFTYLFRSELIHSKTLSHKKLNPMKINRIFIIEHIKAIRM